MIITYDDEEQHQNQHELTVKSAYHLANFLAITIKFQASSSNIMQILPGGVENLTLIGQFAWKNHFSNPINYLVPRNSPLFIQIQAVYTSLGSQTNSGKIVHRIPKDAKLILNLIVIYYTLCFYVKNLIGISANAEPH